MRFQQPRERFYWTTVLILVIAFTPLFVHATSSPTVNRTVTPGAIGPCTWFVSMDGTTPVAQAMVGGLAVNPGDNIVGTAGQDPAAFINTNLFNTINNDVCLAPNTTFNAVSTLKVNQGSMLQGAGTGSTIWSCSGAIICIETNPSLTGPLNLDEVISNLEIDGSTSGVTAALYVDCVQRLRVQSVLFGAGSSGYPAIEFADSATCGTFENELYNINFRASALYNSSIALIGVNPGPEFLYASNLLVNAVGLNIRCSILDVYGTEMDQGPGIVVGSNYIKMAKNAGCNFNPELILWGGDHEPPASETTAISLDANSRANIIANFALSSGCSQVSVAAGGQLSLNSLGAGAKCNFSNQNIPATNAVNSLTAQSAIQGNVCTYTPPANGYFAVTAYILITAYTSGSVVATITFTDVHGTVRSASIVSVGSATWNSGQFSVESESGQNLQVSITGTFTATYDVSCSIVQTG